MNLIAFVWGGVDLILMPIIKIWTGKVHARHEDHHRQFEGLEYNLGKDGICCICVFVCVCVHVLYFECMSEVSEQFGIQILFEYLRPNTSIRIRIRVTF